MTENELIRLIDCRFPINDYESSQNLIRSSIEISPNAAFMVLHELCRYPKPDENDKRMIRTHLEFWKNNFHHPAIPIVLPSAMALINGENISESDCLNAMREISTYKNQYNALAIISFACTTDAADLLYDEIVEKWKSLSNSDLDR